MALAPARYAFEAENGGTYIVRRFSLQESLSQLYHCRLDLVQARQDFQLDALLGRSCKVTASRDGGAERRVCGIVRRAIKLTEVAEEVVLGVEIIPALWALARTRNSRIFQNQPAPDIIKKVLSDGLQPYQRGVRLDLQRSTYAKRVYCAQYQETDFDFVQRLMQEEGIGFYFDHSADQEEMVLFDTNASLRPCSTIDGGTIGVARLDMAHEKEVVLSLDAAVQLDSTSIILHEYDWLQPTRPAHQEAHGQDGGQHERIVYDAAPALVMGQQGNDGAARKQLRLEEFAVHGWLGSGESNAMGFAPGLTVEMEGNNLPELDQEYVIIAVNHHGEAPMFGDGNTGVASEYHNDFICMPADIPYRPAITRRRPVLGMQTATVVGPAGEEVYTDEHGCVKVQFHWDRDGQNNEDSSCWVRVAQAWAGPGYGAFFLPRIGMEVIVQFLEGDPDLPLVTGCVHNGRNAAPFPLPDEKTKSGWITRSSLNGTGSNELVFEDAIDNEEIQLRAQKDWSTIVKNDKTEAVRHDSTRTVEHDDTHTVKNDHTETIEGNDAIEVDKDRSLTVKGNQTSSIDGDKTHDVGGNESNSVKGDRSDSVTGNLDVSVDGSRTDDTSKNLTVNVGKDLSVSVSGKQSIDVSKDATASYSKKLAVDVGQDAVVTIQKNLKCTVTKEIQIKADKTLTLKCGSAEIIVKQDGKVTIKASNIEVNGSGTVKMKGGKVAVN